MDLSSTAGVRVEDSTSQVQPFNNNLFDDEMRQLLEEAEQRLLRKSRRLDVNDPETDEALLSITVPTENGSVPSFSLPKLQPGSVPRPYIKAADDVVRVDATALVDPKQRELAQGFRKVEDPVQVRQRLMQEKQATAGPKWFDLPKTNLTPELKRDLQLLQMRSVLDPKRHYKKTGGGKKSLAPEYSQVGTIIQGPTDYFSGRLNRKERKQTFVEEVLSKDDTMKRFKSKYNEVQVKNSSGKKAHYRKLKEQRSRGIKRR